MLSLAIREIAHKATQYRSRQVDDDSLESALREVLETALRDPMVGVLVVSLCRLNLAVLLQFRASRRFNEEAASLAREAFRGMLQVRESGSGSTLRLQTLECLLSILGRLRRTDEREELNQRLLSESQRMLDYPHLAAALLLSAASYAGQDRYDDAHEIASRAAGFAARSLGNSHPLAVRASLYCAGFAAQSGELQLALDIIAATPSPPHQSNEVCVLYAMQVEGLVKAARGEIQQAVALLSRVLARRLELQGTAHSDVSETSTELGRCLRICGHATEGCALIRSALQYQRHGLGLTHPLTLRTNLELLTCLICSAEPCDLQEATSIGRIMRAEHSLRSSGPRARVDTYVRLALLALVQHERVRARSLVSHAASAGDACAAEVGHEATLALRDWAAILDFEAAAVCSLDVQQQLQTRYECRRRALGEDHPFTLLLAARVSDCLVLQGKITEATQLVWSSAYNLPAKLG